MLSPLTDSGENKDAVHVSQPPLIAVAWRMRRDRVLDPLLGDDLFAVPVATVEIQVSEPGHVSGLENQPPSPDTVPLGIPRPPPGLVSEHVCLAVGVSHVGGRLVHAKGLKQVLGGELLGAPPRAAGDDR